MATRRMMRPFFASCQTRSSLRKESDLTFSRGWIQLRFRVVTDSEKREEALMKKLGLLGLLVGVCVSSACGGKTDKAAQTEKPIMTDKSLYERLGGLPAI